MTPAGKALTTALCDVPCASGRAPPFRRRCAGCTLAIATCQELQLKTEGMESTGGIDPTTVQVTVLGSADAFCSGPNLNAAYLFETPRSAFLLDCGPTILYALKNQGIDTAR